MVNAAFPSVAAATWTQCGRYFAHALACLPLIEIATNALIEAGELLSATGTCDEVDVVDESTIWPGELTPSVDVAEETIILALGSVPPLLC